MSPRFKHGDIVWYQKRGDNNSFAKARIVSVIDIAQSPLAPSYSIQRFDVFGPTIQHVPQARLMSVIDRNRAQDAANV